MGHNKPQKEKEKGRKGIKDAEKQKGGCWSRRGGGGREEIGGAERQKVGEEGGG